MNFRMSTVVILLAFGLAGMGFAQATPDTAKKAVPPKPAQIEKLQKPGEAGVKVDPMVTRINSATSLKTFAELLKASELDKVLEGTGEFTVFAPTDDAFKKIPPDTLHAIKADKARLTALLKNHIVSGKKIGVLDFNKMKGQKIEAESGLELSLVLANGRWSVGDANMTGVHMRTSNGPIHEVDSIIMHGGPAAAAVEKTTSTAKAPASQEKKEGTK